MVYYRVGLTHHTSDKGTVSCWNKTIDCGAGLDMTQGYDNMKADSPVAVGTAQSQAMQPGKKRADFLSWVSLQVSV